MQFVIVDGLPFLFADGKTYAVRWNENGFTVGAEVELPSVPPVVCSELTVFAQCAGRLDSISATEKKAEKPVKATGRQKKGVKSE